jgi:hypothetical protein
LEGLEGKSKEIKLLEYSRLDFLSHAERRVYLRNKLELEEEEVEPVSACAKYSAWASLVLVNCGFAFYVCLFGSVGAD